MNTSTRRSIDTRRLAAVAGILLVLVTAQPAAAAVTWAGDVNVATTDTYKPQILRTGASRAIAIWQRGTTAYARRTSNGGVSWSARQTIATNLEFRISAASSGARVDLAYVKRSTNSSGTVVRRVYYRRSSDGGATWGTQRALTSTSSQVADQAIAHRSNGQVSIAWTGLYSGNIYMRTSTDHGATFASAKYVGHTANSEVGRRVTYVGDLQLAIGTGVTYLAYTSAHETLSVRRTLNRGSSWSGATKLNTAAGPDYSLAASGSKAVIGYTSHGGGMKARFRATTNSGSTWSASRLIVSVPTGSFSTQPTFIYRAGVLAVTVKAGTPGNSPVWLKTSTNFGSTLSARTRVSVQHFVDTDPEPAGLALLDGTILAGYNENRRSPDEGFWVRRSN
ncbi:MAG: sialidase family protein [Chloroflexota bacterium]